jgi:hypothetical protein
MKIRIFPFTYLIKVENNLTVFAFFAGVQVSKNIGIGIGSIGLFSGIGIDIGSFYISVLISVSVSECEIENYVSIRIIFEKLQLFSNL